jgi:phosphopantetheinyl transferase (holo-ACP synthase)
MPLDFNISHDGDWVVLALQRDAASRVGVDVMELALPHFERDVASFVETMELALTPRETAWVLAATTGAGGYEARQAEALRRLYDLWTHKEAYTKALGLGLGFDFARLELRLGDAREQRSVRCALLSDGKEEPRFVFTELLLPPGAERGQAPPTPGEGTGLPSQLVVAQGPLQEAHTQVSPPVALQAAKNAGWLRMTTLGGLLEASRGHTNVTDESWEGMRRG